MQCIIVENTLIKLLHHDETKTKKIYHKQNIKRLVFFKSDRPVCNHPNVNFIKTTLKTIFSLKNRFLHF